MADKWKKDEDWEEESELMNPWRMTLIFTGLAVLAGIICAGLWYFTHLNKPKDNGPDSFAQAQTSSKPTADPSADSQASAAPDVTPRPDTVLSPEQDLSHSPEPDSAHSSPSPSDPAQPVSGSASGSIPKVTDAPVQTREPTVPVNTQEPEAQNPVSGNGAMEFVEVHESVMAKDVVNLRSVPTTRDAENIAAQIKNGETVVRIGINENTGWSKIEYNGETFYAVSQYLTTDLTYRPPAPPSDPNRVTTAGGRVIIFAECDDWISPKEYVNLRTEPSTTEGESTVSCQLNYGEKVRRTGYSTDSGWSRVEYKEQVLYVVTSLMYEVTEE